METFEKLYVDQVNLLKEKYDSPDQNRVQVNTEFFGSFLYKFLEAYQRSKDSKEPGLFYVSTTGVSDKLPEPVKIVFNYKYAPEERQLSISNLYVTMKGISQSFSLKSNAELPEPNKIFDTIAKAYQEHPQKKMDDFWLKLDRHKELLVEKGYDHAGLNTYELIEKFMDRILEGFTAKLLENLATNNVPFSFSVEKEGYFNDNADKIHFRFDYRYDPSTISLNLTGLTAKLDEIKHYPLKNETDLPHSSTVHKQFVENRKLVNDIVPTLNNQYGTGRKARL